jgi:hypothetical protein
MVVFYATHTAQKLSLSLLFPPPSLSLACVRAFSCRNFNWQQKNAYSTGASESDYEELHSVLYQHEMYHYTIKNATLFLPRIC